MTSIEKVHVVTEQLYQLVSQPITKEQRDNRIEAITGLLEMREEHLANVHPPFAENEKQIFEQIVTWNKVIMKKFAELKQQIQQDMMQLKKSKTFNKQYVNPYQNVSTSDGMFYDKRK